MHCPILTRMIGQARRALVLSGGLLAAPIALATAADSPLLDLSFEDLLQFEISSAGKREEQLRDIPASVTILTRKEIERYGWVTFEELLANVPGLFIHNSLYDRRIGSRGTLGGAMQLLVNGVPQHSTRQKQLVFSEIPLVSLPVESIDRIEIIRGPMSVIYGNNAFLGVINVVTNEISSYGPRLSASIGNRSSGRLFARAGKGFSEGFFALNLGGYRTDGFDANYADMMSPEQRAAMEPGMRRSLDGDTPLRDLNLDLSAGWGDWTLDLRYTQEKYGYYFYTPPFDEGNRVRVSTWHASLGWERAVTDDLRLRATALASSQYQDYYAYDFISAALEGDQTMGDTQFNLEFNLLWDPQPEVNLLLGYRFRWNQDIKNDVRIPSLLDLTHRVDDYATNDLFGELSWRPLQQLRVVGGLRLTRLPSSFDFSEDDRLLETQLNERVSTANRNLVTGRVAALWSLDKSQVVKLIWGSSAQDSSAYDYPDPEQIETSELVYVLTRPRWSLSASLFRNQTNNILRIHWEIDPDTGEYRVGQDNSGRWTTHGAELIGEWRPLPALNLSFSTTWQQTEDQTDREPGYSPPLLVKLKADYTHRALTYAAYARYVDAMESDWNLINPTTPGAFERLGQPTDPYWDLGINLGYRPSIQGLYASLHVSNLLNQEIRYAARETIDLERGLIGAGRRAMLTLGWVF